PRCDLRIAVRLAGKDEPLRHALETVRLEPTAERMCLSWRAALPVDKKLLRVEEIRVSLHSVDGIDVEGAAA
ncbi:MAG: DUF2169 domain-containing protein, partial [Myxococcales bacterium]|nr:DUF2169 domain-containing protein [Myxococcales bacterium]